MRLIHTILFLSCFGAFGQTPTPADPPELQKLTSQWQKARAQATAPIDKKYLDALIAMKVFMTKQGNLEGALAADAHIKGLGGGATASSAATTPMIEAGLPKTKNSLEKFLVVTTWTVTMAKDGGSVGEMQITATTKAMFQHERNWGAIDKRSIIMDGNLIKFNEEMTGFTVKWGASGDEVGTFKSRTPAK